MNDSVHGGVLMALADTAAGAASKTYGHARVTLEGKMNFLWPAPINGKPVRVTAKAVHAGRRIGVYECISMIVTINWTPWRYIRCL